MSIQATMVVGNAVKNKMQHKQKQQNACDYVLEDDQLNELLQSQIAEDDTEVDINDMNGTALEEDPTSSPDR